MNPIEGPRKLRFWARLDNAASKLRGWTLRRYLAALVVAQGRSVNVLMAKREFAVYAKWAAETEVHRESLSRVP